MKEILKKIVIWIITIEARIVLKKYKPKIIAITGSAGKTSTKDAIFSVMTDVAFVKKSEKSFNSEIGIPLTIIDCPTGWSNLFLWISNIFSGLWLIIWPHKYPEWLILEVGTRTPGDITKITKWLKPDVVIMTSFGSTPVHIEFFSSKKAVFEEKIKLAKALKDDGILILNHDDNAILSLRNDINRKTFTYGMNDDADFVISNKKITYDEGDTKKQTASGITFRIDYDGKSIPITLSMVLGKNHMYAASAALAVIVSKGFSAVEVSTSLSKYKPPAGRLSLLEGVKNSLIIDDSYNASPDAVRMALETLREVQVQKRKIVILGDMLEIGKYTEDEHKNIGKLATEMCNIIVVVGIRARFYVEGALSKDFSEKNIFHFEDSQKAGKFVEQIIENGDIVLIKGSQGIRTEKAVKEIMQHPELAKYKLVRQEREWINN